MKKAGIKRRELSCRPFGERRTVRCFAVVKMSFYAFEEHLYNVSENFTVKPAASVRAVYNCEKKQFGFRFLEKL